MSLRPECGLAPYETVEGVKLSDRIHGFVDLLKLDVEGAELEVIQDLAETGKLRSIDQILVEYHPALFPGGDGYDWLLETLRQNGFECEVRSGNPALISSAPGAPPVTLYARQVRPAPADTPCANP